MKILILEPYYCGSHKQWADGYKKYSKNHIKILHIKGKFWKWRMHGGAITLARKYIALRWLPDFILATDMIDLSIFLSLTREKTHKIPSAIYFHENQLSYPWSPSDRDLLKNRDKHYAFINYTSALSANRVIFNSFFHMNSFIKELKPFLNHFPDHKELNTINIIKNKSEVLHLGMDLSVFNNGQIKKNNLPIVLWNHRWEYDKNPDLFFKTLAKVKQNGYNFKLAVLGENFSSSPRIFEKAKEEFRSEIIHWGYCDSLTDYKKWLFMSDILPVTSNQEFFGASVMEAIHCGVWPILPKRLSYPELIPKKYQSKHLYNDDNDLLMKINWALNNLQTLRDSNLSEIASKYDWKNIAPKYDEKFQLLCKK